MPIDFINGVDWDDVDEVNKVAAGDVDQINTADAPSTTTYVQTDLIFDLDAGNSSSYSGSGSTWFDLTANNYDFTLVNTPTYSTSDGGYFEFDGMTEYMTNGTFNMADTSAFSFDCWVRPDNSSADRSILGQWHNTASGFGPGILYLDNGDGAVGYDWIIRKTGGSTSRIGTTTANGTVGAWNHVVATFTSTKIQLYVNNSLIGSTSTGDTIVNGTNDGLGIGADRDTGGRYMDGRISIIRAYSKELTAAEVSQNYNAIKGRYGL